MERSALGRRLVELRRLSEKDLEALLVRERVTGRPLEQLVVEAGIVKRDELSAILAEERTVVSGSSVVSDVIKPEMPDEVRAASAAPKNRFGRYVLLERIGKGGMGVVHRAWDLELNRPVALKFITDAEPEDVNRFVREARTAARLSHPNIIAVHEVGCFEGRYFIAMEFVPGKTLDAIKPPLRRAVELMRDAALGLQAAHDAGVIHRDIKPQNLMVRADGRVCVMDFGLARASQGDSRLTQTGTIVGTPSFMSPEQAAASKSIDPRSDIYSLGATLYQLVTGRLPFDGATPLETIRKVAEQEPVRPTRFNPKVPAALEKVILKAMSKERERRYAHAREFAADLERFLAGEDVMARGSSVVTRAMRKVRKNPMWVVTSAALALLLAAGFVWALSRSRAGAEFDRLVRDGRSRFEKGDFRDALRILSRAEQLRPGDPSVRKRIAECEQRIRELEERVREEEARRKELEDRQRKLAEARPLFDRGSRTLDEAAKDLYRPGADLNRTRVRLQEAIDGFTEALRVFPDHHDALFGRARARILRFEHDEAERDLSRAIALAPTFTSAYVERGKLAMQRMIEMKLDLGWKWDDKVAAKFRPWEESARADFEKAVETGAEEGHEYFQALLAFVREKMQECVDLCKASLQKNSAQEEVCKLLGGALHFGTGLIGAELSPEQRRNLEAAVAAYTRAIDLRANYYEARIMRANEYHTLDDPDRMRADLDSALAQRPGDALGCWMMGQYYGRSNDSEQALAWYEKGLRSKPDSFANLVNHAVQLSQVGRFDAASAEVERAIQANPAHYFPWYLRGSIRSKNKDIEGAIADLEKSTRLSPTFYSAWYNLGALYYNSKRWLDARGAFDRALQLGHPKRDEIEQILRQIDAKLGD